jgi:hypothetical protein
MSDDNTQGAAEPSPASDGSHVALCVSIAVLIINVCLLLSIVACRVLGGM